MRTAKGKVSRSLSRIFDIDQTVLESMASLENIGNLWDQLSELHQKDPQKYQEVIEESAKEYAKLKLPPLPHTCILVREKGNHIGYFINILAWERLAEDKNGALPMAGGFLTRKFEKIIYSLAVNNRVLTDIMVKGTVEEKNSLIQLVFDFLENRQDGKLKVDRNSWSFIRGKEFEGNLNEIQNLFMAPSKDFDTLKTSNPKSLLNQIHQINPENTENPDKEKSSNFSLKTEPENRKKLVQEIRPKKSEKSEFAKNLQKGLVSDEKKSQDQQNSVKIFEEQNNQISAVRTKKLETKRPLFGRAYNTGKNVVKLKFLLNGVKDERDVFFYFPKTVKQSKEFSKMGHLDFLFPSYFLGSFWFTNNQWLHCN